jgi:glyoxylase-like metal-dependent hydrolase (beta-lactamase superfamily II)
MRFSTSWNLLEVSRTRRDAGALFGEEPRTSWIANYISQTKADVAGQESFCVTRSNHVSLAAHVLLIQTESDTILVDTGTPAASDGFISDDWSNSKLRAIMRSKHIMPKDVTKVILTSPDIDHAGGMLHYDRAGNAGLAFYKATAYYHESECKRARPRSVARADVALGLLDQAEPIAVSEITEVAEGVLLHPVNGPSSNGCIVELKRGGDRVLYMGDLCPTLYHLNSSLVSSYDDAPDQTYKERKAWLEQAIEHGYLVIFGHGVNIKAGYVEDQKGGLRFKPITTT